MRDRGFDELAETEGVRYHERSMVILKSLGASPGAAIRQAALAGISVSWPAFQDGSSLEFRDKPSRLIGACEEHR